MKEKLLIVSHHLTIGGVQKSLISALPHLDYDKYDVTLYLRKNRTTLLPYVDERVNVIINEDKTKYYRKPFAVFLQVLILFFSLIKNKKLINKYEKLLADKIRLWSMEYEYNTYFKNIYFDKAISYVQGYEVLFVSKYINAKEKFMFFHTSTDEIHEIHEKALPGFTRIAALHNEQAELLKQWYPDVSDKITIVENYVDRDTVIKQSNEYEVPETDKSLVLCSCGRLSSVKGFNLATESAEILKNNGIDFLWYFVGDGPERKNLEEIIKELSLENNIIITGMKENPYPYMRACDIYVQPSYEEAMPVTIIEAKKLAKPVITTATVGGNKLVENNVTGLIAEINSHSLARAIEILYKDPELLQNISDNLENISCDSESEKFRNQWRKLLEG